MTSGAWGVRIWGARGSLPRLVEGQARFGGNTVCLEVLHGGSQRVVLDAGTGIANLGDQILAESSQGGVVHLFISHYHWDHIMGLPFFGPVYHEGFKVHLYGLGRERGYVEDMLEVVFSPYYSPIYSPKNLLSRLVIPPSAPRYAVDGLTLSVHELPDIHPGGYLLIRVEGGGRSLVYASDVELREPSVVEAFVDCCRGCDLLICNAAFSHERYLEAVGWGHSSLEVSHEVAHSAGVAKVMGIHYDPLRTDDELLDVLERERDRHPGTTLELAEEGAEVWL